MYTSLILVLAQVTPILKVELIWRLTLLHTKMKRIMRVMVKYFSIYYYICRKNYIVSFFLLGTHVAGTIGGSTFGVAKRVLIHGVKILDRNGDGTTSALVQAISHITQNAPHGRSIINLSLTGPRSETIDNALSMAVRQHGIPVFASAGNSGDDACNYSPAANPDVFTVGASDNHDGIPPFSSYGQCVRIYAPGAGITSSWVDNKSQIMDGTR